MSAEQLVIKIGGSALKDLDALDAIVSQLVTLHQQGRQLVIVHGGGPHISNLMREQSLTPIFINGLRVTDDETIMAVYSALGFINHHIVEALNAKGVPAVGLHAEPGLLNAVKMSSAGDNQNDLGWVGDIVGVDAEVLAPYEGTVLVVSPIGWDLYWNKYNLNADHAAMALARELKAGALVFLSDVPGVLADCHNLDSRLPVVNESTVHVLIEQGIVSGGMIPKLLSSVNAIKGGVGKICLADGRQERALLEVLDNPSNTGTTICA